MASPKRELERLIPKIDALRADLDTLGRDPSIFDLVALDLIEEAHDDLDNACAALRGAQEALAQALGSANLAARGSGPSR